MIGWNTDDVYTLLREWAAGPHAETLARSRAVRPRIRTRPRESRPEDRTRSNRFKR